jgi:hypothetical protein
MERPTDAAQRDIPAVIRPVVRPAQAKARSLATPCTHRRGVLAELDHYPELRH